MEDDATYYYADGKRIPLKKTDQYVAIDISDLNAKEKDAEASTVRDAVKEQGEHLRRGHYLVKRDTISKKLRETIEKLGISQPVFRQDKNLIIVLPEILVYETRKSQQSSLDDWINQHKDAAEIVKRLGSRVTIHVKSKSGPEALKIANKLREEIGTEVAEPRMMQVINRFNDPK